MGYVGPQAARPQAVLPIVRLAQVLSPSAVKSVGWEEEMGRCGPECQNFSLG